MTIQSVKCFSHTGDLKGVSPKHLIKFLTPYAEFLTSKGFKFPVSDEEVKFPDYWALLNILMTPSPDMPGDLIASLHCIREMATPDGLDALLEEAEIQGINIDDEADYCPIDVAVQIWLHDRHIIERAHAERFLIKPCTFVYYQAGKQSDADFIELSKSTISALERDLDRWFESKKRGCGCRVFVFHRDDGIWFMVWHGAPSRFEGCIENGEPSCICYHPERHDVLVYQPVTCELQIDADSKGEREIYRKLFGRHLFGDDHHFPGTAIYTLDPLKADAERSLTCSDVDGMEWVKLHKIEFCWGGRIKSIETIESDDVFEVLRSGDAKIPSSARYTEASLLIKFADSTVPRTVSIQPQNIISYQLDSDCEKVEELLRKRGFVLFAYLLLLVPFDCLLGIFQNLDSIIC